MRGSRVLAAWRDGRCTYNETRRRVTVIAAEKQYVLHIAALVIQHAMCMSHIVICGLSGSTMFHFFPIIS
jgi:hypothetical protein